MAVDNLKMQQQINAAIQARQGILRAETAELQKQLSIAKSIQDTMGGLNTGGASDDINELAKALEGASQEAAEFGDISEDMLAEVADSIDNGTEAISGFGDGLSRLIDRFPTLGAVGAGALDGVISGFRFSFSLIQNVASAVGSVVSGIWSMGKAILSIPFRIMQGLIDMAKTGGGGTELAQAFENVRKEFGDFRQAVSRDVIGMARSMRGALAETGLNAMRVFGNMAEALDHFRELAVEMGSTFHNVVGGMTKVELQRFASFQKGLGLSGEQMKTFAQEAIGSGESINEKLREVANFTLQMSDQFDLSQKVLARDIAKMRGDVEKFGNVTVKKMAESAVFVRKLGLEIEDLAGILDKYDNFETAAEGVSEFARAFGVNLDAFQLIQAETGAERLDLMRKAFLATGQDAARMSRVELKLLADAAGLGDANIAKLAFSAENAGKSMEEIQKGSAKAEKQQVTQAEAMEKLAASIERMVKSGQQLGPGGFFAQFFQGLQTGMKRSPEFIKLMMGIRTALRSVWRIGFQLGRVLPKLFAPFSDMLGAFNKLIGSESAIIGFFQNFSNTLRMFLGDIQNVDPETAVRNLFERLKDATFNFFGSSSGPAAQLGKAFANIGIIMIKAIGGLVPVLMKEMGSMFTKIGQFIADPSKVIAQVEAAGDPTAGTRAAVLKALKGAFDGIVKAWPELWKGIQVLFGAVFDKVKPWLQKHGPKIIGGALSLLFGPAVLGAVINGAVAGLGTLFVKGVGGVLLSSSDDIVSKTGPKVASKFGRFLGPIGLALAAGVGISDGMAKFKDNTLNEIDKQFPSGNNEAAAKMGAAAGGIIDAFTFGLLPDDIAQKISTAVGKLSAKFFEILEKEFGGSFVERLKGTFSSSIDLFGALGDMVKALFDGDSDAFGDALANGLTAAFELAIDSVVFMFEELPIAIGKLLWKGLKVVGPGIIKAFVKLFEKVSKKLDKIWDGIRKSIIKKMKDAWSRVERVWESAIDWFSNLPGKIKTSLSSLGPTIKSVFAAAWDTAKEAWSGVTDWFRKNVTDPVKTVFNNFKADAIEIFGGIWEGIKVSFKKIQESLIRWFKGALRFILKPIIDVIEKIDQYVNVPKAIKNMVTGIKAELQMKSPSKVMRDIGENIVRGLDIGMAPMGKLLQRPVTAMATKSRDLMTESANLRKRLQEDRARVVDLQTKVGALQNGSILGSDGQITVRRPDHTLTINLKAVFDTGQVERVMIDRPNTKIVTAERPFN